MTLDMLTQLGGSGAREAWDDGRVLIRSGYAFDVRRVPRHYRLDSMEDLRPIQGEHASLPFLLCLKQFCMPFRGGGGGPMSVKPENVNSLLNDEPLTFFQY